MRYCTYAVVVLCFFTRITHAVDQPTPTPAEQEVLNVSKARMDASNRRDPVAWSRYVAEDCIFSDENGVRHPKADPLNVVARCLPNTITPKIPATTACTYMAARRCSTIEPRSTSSSTIRTLSAKCG